MRSGAKEKRPRKGEKKDDEKTKRLSWLCVAQYFVLHETVIVFSLYTKNEQIT